MTTPNFTGNERVFDGLNLLIPRGTNPNNSVTYNARFAGFLNAINSSEEMRTAVLQFQASGGRFENNSGLNESTFDKRIFFNQYTWKNLKKFVASSIFSFGLIGCIHHGAIPEGEPRANTSDVAKPAAAVLTTVEKKPMGLLHQKQQHRQMS